MMVLGHEQKPLCDHEFRRNRWVGSRRLPMNSVYRTARLSQSSLLLRGFAFFALACFLGLYATATTLAVEIRDADRVSLHPTDPTELTLTGQDLRTETGEVADLWCSSPMTVEVLDPEDKDRNLVRYRLTPAQPLGGVVVIRAFTGDSVSQAMLFFVSSPASTPVPAETDKPLQLPFGIDLKSQGNGETTIRFECEKGQRFIAEIVGARIGSAVDAVLVLMDRDQHELTFADDHPVTGSDPILEWTAGYSGLHSLTVKDVEYRGGLRMHLRVSDKPVAGRTKPTAIRRGETRRMSAVSDLQSDILSNQIMHVPFRESAGLGYLRASSVLAPFIKSDLPVYLESEGTSSPVPAVYCGELSAAGEVDIVQFDVRKGDALTISFLSTDGPFVGDIRLFRGDQQVRDHHFGRDPNGSLKYVVPETDNYRIEIREVLNRAGFGFEYCLSIRNDLAPSLLRIARVKQKDRRIRNDKPHRQVWFNDESLPVLVRVDRRGYNGPIMLHAELDGQPCRVDGQIDEKKNEAEVQIHLPAEVPARQVKHLTIFGTCQITGHRMFIPIDLSEHINRDFMTFSTIPANVGHAIAVVVTPYIGKEE
jgi:hypothetical protein